ncbi:hypothetical protein E1287_30835 [Actinomadura sp. KC06]|uniref:hypothetical protein n=1 Tax=Actinomadura sp. KC06 TaxID=2530369 RepID=UPI001053AC07|nr:hypothetical protein [Actinomadura sp. KC06]TDD29515.1 hypothetical protein E1287_30835 [Actinomadura sp. KC06]
MRPHPVRLDGDQSVQHRRPAVSVRRLAALGAVLLAVAVLAGCAGGRDGRGGPAPPQRAWFRIDVLPEGDAFLDLYAAGRLRSDAEVRALARRLAEAAFPGARGVRVRTEDDRGLSFASAEIDRAYRTGRDASLRIDTAGAARLLRARGFRDTSVQLRLPSVPSTVRTDGRPSGDRTWRLRPDGPAPVLSVEMRPSPVRWLGVLALPVLGAAGVALGFFVRRRIFALPAAGAAVAAALAAVVLPTGRQGDNLGVAGLLGGTALEVAAVVPLAAVPLGLPAAMLLAAVAVRGLTRPDVPAGHEARPRDTGVFW